MVDGSLNFVIISNFLVDPIVHVYFFWCTNYYGALRSAKCIEIVIFLHL